MHREDSARKDSACVSFHFLSRKMKELFSFILITITFIQQTNFNKKKRALWHWDDRINPVFLYGRILWQWNLKYFRYFIADSDIRLRCLHTQTVWGTFDISLSVHMCWQGAICKPDTLLCDRKCNFSLPEKENTWRNSNQRVSLTCHLQRVRAVYQCQRGAGGITSSLPSPSLFLTRCDADNLFLLACLTCPGGFAASQTPASPGTMTGNKMVGSKLMEGLNKQIFVSEIKHLSIWCPLTEQHYSDPETTYSLQAGVFTPSPAGHNLAKFSTLRDRPPSSFVWSRFWLVGQKIQPGCGHWRTFLVWPNLVTDWLKRGNRIKTKKTGHPSTWSNSEDQLSYWYPVFSQMKNDI